MPTVESVMGVIESNGGDTPRKASLISFIISWNFPNGSTVRTPEPVQPHDHRPPDTVDGEDLLTIPLPVGTVVHGDLVGGSLLYWYAHEREAMGTCQSGGQGSAPLVFDIASGKFIPGGGSGAGGQAGGGNPPAGGGGGGVVTR